jgi:hypothetical protein
MQMAVDLAQSSDGRTWLPMDPLNEPVASQVLSRGER